MRSLTEKELLNVWEDCIDLSLTETSLHLIGAASSISDLSGIAALSIGQRDVRLLQLREWMFGSRLKNMAVCPHCSESIEWENNVNDLRLQPILADAGKVFNAEIDGFKISYRLPTSRDIFNLDHDAYDNGNSVNALLSQCILEIKENSVTHAAKDLPQNIIAQLNEHMSHEDPQADITILLTCPSCAGQWQAGFDIMSYLWSEINSWARHILQEVYILAKFFGWSENDILKISPKRRQLYLQMVQS
ncbi:MAG: hypothetical protein ABIN93_02045 [Ginsengibacter sp.]